ncbi:uncharacterized protein LOC143115134 [Alosa pseudoharengus]|uniref:uncharacterized protein LOC143115134 n=1 Tax=Alosa pseudoharengus TaxID=34774 RepID=UPI003F8AB3BB
MDVASHNRGAGKDAGDAFSKLAELMAQSEQKQDGRNQKSHQSGVSTCEECHQDFPDLAGLVRHQQKLHVLRKPHRCKACGQEFALLSTLQLHKCLSSGPVCQLCHGKAQRGAPCSACSSELADPKGPQEQSHLYRHHHDNSPYACAPCGRAFSHKQELLYHQQAGGCQPAPLSPKALKSSTVPSYTPVPTPTPSYASLPPSPPGPGACLLCRRVFRSPAGLANHQRVWHPSQWAKNSTKLPQKSAGKMNGKTLEKTAESECKSAPDSAKKSNASQKKGQQFPCRSCDRVFSQTSMLHQHRKEVHRREKRPWREHRPSAKSTRQRKKGETYPCLVCGKVFLHHLTRWAHLRTHSAQQQNQMRKVAQGVKPSKITKETKAAEKNPTQKAKKTKCSSTAKADTKKQRRKRESHEEEGEFPCPSCLEVFSSPADLCKHQEVHQPAEITKNCSVCKEEMTPVEGRATLPELLYHCVPCRQAFSTLSSFLQHCQMHLPSDNDEEGCDGDD